MARARDEVVVKVGHARCITLLAARVGGDMAGIWRGGEGGTFCMLICAITVAGSSSDHLWHT